MSLCDPPSSNGLINSLVSILIVALYFAYDRSQLMWSRFNCRSFKSIIGCCALVNRSIDRLRDCVRLMLNKFQHTQVTPDNFLRLLGVVSFVLDNVAVVVAFIRTYTSILVSTIVISSMLRGHLDIFKAISRTIYD